MITIRRSDIYLGILAAGILALTLIFVHASRTVRTDGSFMRERELIVTKYGLTDLCLFTDARYSRNPSMADRATPFQDHPGSLEHFPSGSIIKPPLRMHNGMD